MKESKKKEFKEEIMKYIDNFDGEKVIFPAIVYADSKDRVGICGNILGALAAWCCIGKCIYEDIGKNTDIEIANRLLDSAYKSIIRDKKEVEHTKERAEKMLKKIKEMLNENVEEEEK